MALRYVPKAEVEYSYQTIGARIVARFIDGFLFIPFWFLYLLFAQGEDATAFWLMTIANFLAVEAYTIYFHGRFGQTLGKMAMKVKVYDINGGKLSYQQAFYREAIDVSAFFIRYLPLAPAALAGRDPHKADGLAAYANYLSWGILVVDFLAVFSNAQRRAGHDFIAGSVVVRMAAPLD